MIGQSQGIDWAQLLAPAVGALVLGLMTALIALVTGAVGGLKRYLEAHNQAASATAVDAAWKVVQGALETGASAVATKISTGALPIGDRGAWDAAARQELELVAQRVPDSLAVLKPVEGALLAAMMAKVDSKLMTAGTPLGKVMAPLAPLEVPYIKGVQ